MIRRRMVLLALPLAACGGPKPPPPPPPPPEIDLRIEPGADQNPDPSGQATPVAVQLFQLAGNGRFESADAYSIAGNAASVLGDELLGSEQVIVTPGQAQSLTRAPKPGAQFLGVAVLFRDIDHAQWRAIAPIAPHGPTKLVLRISGLNATLGSG